MKIFILEDSPERIAFFKSYLKHSLLELYIAHDVIEAKEILSKTKHFDLMFLDHDLGGEAYVDSNIDNTGYQLAKYIADNGITATKIIIHSMNSVGAKNMKTVLPAAQCVPFIAFTNGVWC